MYATLTTRYETVIVERAGPVVYFTLDRPEARNAMNQQMVDEIIHFFESIRADRSIRCVVIRGAGGTFCAGADIKEMADPAFQTAEARAAYAHALDDMLSGVLRAPQVTISVVEGAAMGGGFGLVCVTDIAIAEEDVKMALPEVRLGLAPAVISPYAIARIGLNRMRQLALTGRRLDGVAALKVGLVHEVATDGTLDIIVDGYVDDILLGSPEALATTKQLLFQVAEAHTPEATRGTRVETLNRLRAGAEGREGMAAFAQKRTPAWVPERERYLV